MGIKKSGIHGRRKIEARVKKGIFSRFSTESKTCRMWLCEESKVIISENVKVLEKGQLTIGQGKSIYIVVSRNRLMICGVQKSNCQGRAKEDDGK